MSNSAIIGRAIDGAALAPITPDQRRELAILARRAFEKCGRPDSAKGSCADVPGNDAFGRWRHEQTMQAVERSGLTALRQEDYAQVKGHFLRLLGQVSMADRMQARADMEPRRVALAKLRHECDAASDVIDRGLEYAAAIARSRFKTAEIEDLSEKQIWMLVFDVRRNAQRRRARERVA